MGVIGALIVIRGAGGCRFERPPAFPPQLSLQAQVRRPFLNLCALHSFAALA